MGQLKRRVYILVLSLLVLIVALAGLLGVLDSLPKPNSAASTPGGDSQPTATPPTDDSENPAQPSGNETTPAADITPKFSLSLPDSFKLDLSKATNPGLDLNAAVLPHLPILEVTGAENTEYLKSITSSYFDGVEWIQENLGDYIEYNGELIMPPGIDPDQIVMDNITVSTLVDIVNGKVAIPTSMYPVSVNSSEPLLYFPDDMTFLAEEEFPEEYIFETVHFIFDRQMLANAELDAIEEYLQLPDNITPRTYELADNITGGIESSFLMAKALEDYLKTNYTYDFNAEPAPEGREPNDYFLFESQAGVCTNFNSAFVILARAAGIPARLAGGFAITPQAGEQEVYTDQAHAWSEVKFKDLGWYTFDATGSPPARITTVTDITKIGSTAKKGDELAVAGTVWTDSMKPAEGVLVEILANETKDAQGATLIGKGLAAGGKFNIQAVIPGEMAVGKYHILAHTLKSAVYGESWSDPVIKVVSGVNISLQFNPRIKTGGTLKLNGVLTGDFGEKLAEQKLEITINGLPAATLVTDKEGRFMWEKDFPTAGNYLLKASYPGTEYFLAASRNTEFKVLAPAAIEFKADGNTIGEPVAISGRLTESGGGALAGRTLTVSIDGILQDTKTVTGDDGRFKSDYTFNKLGTHNIEVKFTGDAEYYDASASLDIEIAPESASSFPWTIVIIVLAAAALAAGGWFLYRRLKNRPTSPAGYEIEEEKIIPAIAAIEKPYTPGAGLMLEFPQIKEPLPDVWGKGDELTIAVRLNLLNTGSRAAPLDLSINNETAVQLTAGANGDAELKHIFTEKGSYELTASYKDETNNKTETTTRPMRIVDYREEIVDLFNRLVDTFREAGIKISDEFTPRKIQYLAKKANAGIPEKALEDAISCFEETDYSLHPITRQHYEIMYLAQREIREHGVKPAAAV